MSPFVNTLLVLKLGATMRRRWHISKTTLDKIEYERKDVINTVTKKLHELDKLDNFTTPSTLEKNLARIQDMSI